MTAHEERDAGKGPHGAERQHPTPSPTPTPRSRAGERRLPRLLRVRWSDGGKERARCTASKVNRSTFISASPVFTNLTTHRAPNRKATGRRRTGPDRAGPIQGDDW